MNPDQKQAFILNTLFLLVVLMWVLAVICWIFPVTLPFWLGLLIAWILKPVSLGLCNIFKFRRKNAVFSVLLIFYILIGTVLWLLCSVLFRQSQTLVGELPIFYENTVKPLLHRCALGVNGLLDDVSPHTAQLLIQRSDEFAASLSSSLSGFSSAALSQAASIAKRIPFWLTTVAFSILCSVFISLDYSNVTCFLLRQFPKHWRPLLFKIKDFLCNTLLKMAKAYLILLLITFVQLLLGFYLLGIEKPFLFALILSLLDLLPFIGTGLVLLPLGIYYILSGQAALGSGLLILYGILTIVRNIMEPKLVGSSIGLNPICTLVAMYAGLKLWGFIGLLAAPILILLLCFLQEEGYIKLFS